MLTCCEVIENLADYLARNLRWRVHAGVLIHLLICGQCRNYFATYRDTIQLAKQSVVEEPYSTPAPLREELVQQILRSRG